MWVKPLINIDYDTVWVRFTADPAGDHELPQLLGFELEGYLRKYLREQASTERMRTIEADAQLFIQTAIARKELYFDESIECWRYKL